MNMRIMDIPTGLFGLKRLVLADTFALDFDALLACSDALAFLRTISGKTIRLIVTSPPYNIGKPYEERKNFHEYLDWQFEIIKECSRVLVNGGSLCWQVGNYIDKGEVFPLDVFFYNLIKRFPEFKLRNRIIWHFEHGGSHPVGC
jgi:adenine-specific DNA-methyltransferase